MDLDTASWEQHHNDKGRTKPSREDKIRPQIRGKHATQDAEDQEKWRTIHCGNSKKSEVKLKEEEEEGNYELETTQHRIGTKTESTSGKQLPLITATRSNMKPGCSFDLLFSYHISKVNYS